MYRYELLYQPSILFAKKLFKILLDDCKSSYPISVSDRKHFVAWRRSSLFYGIVYRIKRKKVVFYAHHQWWSSRADLIIQNKITILKSAKLLFNCSESRSTVQINVTNIFCCGYSIHSFPKFANTTWWILMQFFVFHFEKFLSYTNRLNGVWR
jgi:hypothetical protein